MTRVFIFLLCSFCIGISSCSTDSADDEKDNQTDSNTGATLLEPAAPDSTENMKIYVRYKQFTDAYKKEAYVPEKVFIGQPAQLQLTSHPDARTYQTAFRKGLEKGANFAGSFVIVSVGCGAACQQNYVLNVRTGEVIDKVQSEEGAFYQPESRLFIANPPDSTVNYTECVYCAPRIYLFQNEKFTLVATDTL